jgi:integrase
MQAQTSSARRVRDARHPGVYYRETPRGRRWEITFLDSSGRRRWKTVEGGQREAVAALEDLRSRLRRGERVAPSRLSLGELIDAYLASATGLRPRTREKYETGLRVHVRERLGRRRASSVTEDDVAGLIAGMLAEGKAAWTVRGVLVPLSRVFAYGVRRGLVSGNPVARLERGERPRAARREMVVLSREEIAALIGAARAPYRALLATAVFTGLRQSELLGLVWGDVDFEAGVVRVRKQLGRDGARVEPKTAQARREVVMMPALGRILREHRLASSFSGEGDPVFASASGSALDHRNASRRGLEPAVKRAKIGRRVTMHDLRHTFASLLVAEGLNVVFVSRQLGHADPSITLKVYSHLFDAAEHAARASAALEASFGNALETTGGNGREPGTAPEGGKVASLRASGV